MSSEEDEELDYMLKIVVIGATITQPRRLRCGEDQSDFEIHQRQVQLDLQTNHRSRLFPEDYSGGKLDRKSSVLGHCRAGEVRPTDRGIDPSPLPSTSPRPAAFWSTTSLKKAAFRI
jgi:hypothetical protein